MYVLTDEEHMEIITNQQKILTNQEEIKRNIVVSEFLGIRDLAKIYAVSVATVYTSPWLQPNYGRGDIEQPKRWRRITIEKWLELTPEERKKQWQQLTSRERDSVLLSTRN